MSRNTHVTLLTTASSKSRHPQLSCPHNLRDSRNLVLHSNSVVTKPQPFPIVYSIVFSRTLSLSKPVHIPVFQSCVSCVSCLILCLPFLYTLICYVPFLICDIPDLM